MRKQPVVPIGDQKKRRIRSQEAAMSRTRIGTRWRRAESVSALVSLPEYRRESPGSNQVNDRVAQFGPVEPQLHKGTVIGYCNGTGITLGVTEIVQGSVAISEVREHTHGGGQQQFKTNRESQHEGTRDDSPPAQELGY
jgi:hypothetical protein